LIDLQFVREVGLNVSPELGDQVFVGTQPDAGYMVSAEIGVDFIAVMCANFAIEPVWQHKETTTPSMGTKPSLIAP